MKLASAITRETSIMKQLRVIGTTIVTNNILAEKSCSLSPLHLGPLRIGAEQRVALRSHRLRLIDRFKPEIHPS